MTAGLLLGVDGGNSKTIAVVATPDGTILGTGRVDRGADIHRVGTAAALAVFEEAVDQALQSSPGHSDREAVGGADMIAAFSLAGADWPEDVTLLQGLVGGRWPRSTVVNDAIGALRAAIASGPGVVVVIGTGTATGARGPDGRIWHSGFWQETQGGHELGVRLLQAVVRAELGIDPPTILTRRVLDATGQPTVEALLHHATARDIKDRRDPATLAAVLLSAADDGDASAVDIVERHGRSLGRTAAAAARQVAISRDELVPLALTGGVLRNPAVVLRRALIEAVRDDYPAVREVAPALEPAVAGALLLAFDAAAVDLSPTVTERIAAGLRASPVGGG